MPFYPQILQDLSLQDSDIASDTAAGQSSALRVSSGEKGAPGDWAAVWEGPRGPAVSLRWDPGAHVVARKVGHRAGLGHGMGAQGSPRDGPWQSQASAPCGLAPAPPSPGTPPRCLSPGRSQGSGGPPARATWFLCCHQKEHTALAVRACLLCWGRGWESRCSLRRAGTPGRIPLCKLDSACGGGRHPGIPSCPPWARPRGGCPSPALPPPFCGTTPTPAQARAPAAQASGQEGVPGPEWSGRDVRAAPCTHLGEGTRTLVCGREKA